MRRESTARECSELRQFSEVSRLLGNTGRVSRLCASLVLSSFSCWLASAFGEIGTLGALPGSALDNGRSRRRAVSPGDCGPIVVALTRLPEPVGPLCRRIGVVD
jgi:hypothetical protein